MKLPKLPEKLSLGIGMTKLKIQAASPEILLGLGIVTMGGAVVAGIIAARHHDEIIADHEGRLEEAKANYILPDAEEDEFEIEGPDENGDYYLKDGTILNVRSDKEIARAVRKAYFKTIARFIRLYGLTAALMALSTLCFVGMHNIQAGRITGLVGAYTGLQEYIKRYEARNIELNGQKSHEMCKYGYKTVEVEEEDPDTGEVVKETKNVPIYEDCGAEEMAKLPFHDQYYIFSERTASNCTGIANNDYAVLVSAKNFAIQKVASEGVCKVCDVLEYLGIHLDSDDEDDTELLIRSQYEGWVKGHGDDPDFGVEDPINNRFLAGYNHEEVYLDFNIHGNVIAILMEDQKKKARLKKNLTEERLAEEIM